MLPVLVGLLFFGLVVCAAGWAVSHDRATAWKREADSRMGGALEALKEKDESIAYLRGVAQREGYVDGGERSSLVSALKERTAELEALRPVRAVLGDALEALREARRTVEVPSLFPPGHPRAGESLPWHALAVEVEARAASLGAQGVEVAERRELKERGERIRDLEHTVRELEANREESIRTTTRREYLLKQEKDTAYSERNRLAVALARVGLVLGWRAGVGTHQDVPGQQWDADWRTLLFIDTPAGQVSWHLHDSERYLVASLPKYPGTWDGHTTAQKWERLERVGPPVLVDGAECPESCGPTCPRCYPLARA